MSIAQAVLLRALAVFALALAVGQAAAQGELPSETAPPGEPAEAEAIPPIVEEAEALWDGWVARNEQIEALRRQLRGSRGEDLLVLEEKIWTKQLEAVALARELAGNVLDQEKQGLDATQARERIEGGFSRATERFERHFSWRDERVAKLRAERESAEGTERVGIEKRLSREQANYQIALAELVKTIAAMESLGLDATDARAELESRLIERAEDLSGRLALDRKAREALRERLARDPDSADLQTAVEATEESFSRRERTLSATIALMEPIGLETSAYKQTLIETTGQLSTGIFDRKVAIGLLQGWSKLASARLAERGPVWAMQVFLFVLVLVLFWVLAAIARRVVRRFVTSDRFDISTLLRDTLVAWSSRVVFSIGVLVALSQVGVQIGPLLAGLGIAGFIVGFALQDSLANFAAGAMILFYRPYDVNDTIETGTVRGMVNHMSLVSTTILTFDNQTLIVPNNKIWGDVIRNVTAQSARRLDLVFRAGYEQDVERMEKLFYDVLAEYDKVLDEPAPQVRVNELGEFAVEYAVRPWVRREDYWDAYWDLTRAVKMRFDREGISAPRPQRELVVRADPATIGSPQASS